ncbi:MAG: ATP-dependent helicase, partial [Solirubrobacteraceae bacterium]|nr:ATP-dependent helicase [Solirubrobacteraceae bacterium]
MLAEEGALDQGDLIFGALSLLKRPEVKERFVARYSHLLVDDAQRLSLAELTLVLAVADQLGCVTAVADADCAPASEITGGDSNLAAIGAQSGGERIELTRSLRCRERIVLAGQAVLEQRLSPPLSGEPGGSVRGWRCSSERAQAQSIAAEIEHLIQASTAPESIAVLVSSVRDDGRAIAAALDERAVPHQLGAGDQLFSRGEVKDVLAWLRLLTSPADASATVRALARAPIELRAVDLARCVQIARRRKLDMVSALNAATESPQIPPEARERIVTFLKLQKQAAAAIDELRPDRFVHRLIDRLGLRRQQLFAAQADVVEGLRCLARFEALAGRFAERSPQSSGREFAEYVVAVADAGLRESDESGGAEQLPASKVAVVEVGSTRGLSFDHVFVAGMERRRSIDDEQRKLAYVAITRAAETVTLSYSERGGRSELQPPSQLAEAALTAAGAEWEERGEELFGPDEALHGAFNELRDELLGDLPRVAGTFAELRLDNDLDLTLGVVRYLELAKLAAVIGRPADQDVESALAQANAVLLQSATATQREALESSPLDELILGAEHDARVRSAATARRGEPSLEAFLPRRGEGLVLSASDIETYRACPLRYKFARVFRIPQEPTMNQRFGILFHQVLE